MSEQEIAFEESLADLLDKINDILDITYGKKKDQTSFIIAASRDNEDKTDSYVRFGGLNDSTKLFLLKSIHDSWND